MPEPMTFDDVKDLEFPTYHHLRVTASTEDKIPLEVKRSAIDLHNFVERCKEEILYLDEEMVRLVEYFHNIKYPTSHVLMTKKKRLQSMIKNLTVFFNQESLNAITNFTRWVYYSKITFRKRIKGFIPSTQWKCQSTSEHESEVETMNISEYYTADDSDEEDDVSSIHNSSDSDSESIWDD